MSATSTAAVRGTERNWIGLALHHRVRERIIQDLVQSGAAPGERFSTETELAHRLRVSRNTVRKAMDGLERDGYVARRRRVGALVGDRFSTADHVATTTAPRLRVVFVLPSWDDTVEGFYAGRLLRELTSLRQPPPLAVEVRHHEDPIQPGRLEGTAVVAVDPAPEMESHLRQLARRGLRVIVDGPYRRMEGLACFMPDRRQAVRDAVKKFHALGHRAVGLMNHDQVHLNFQLPFQGYLDAHRELGIPIPPQGIVQTTHREEAGHAPDVRNISAWICAYIGSVGIVAQECQRAGLSVPEDVSILSLDDPGDVPFAPLGKRLSVARDDVRTGAARIHECLTNWRPEHVGSMTVIPPAWIERETIAAPRR